MEQKHTPYYYVDTQFGDRYCLMDGNDMSKKGAYRMLDEIKKVAELTKENELLTRENWEMKRWSVHEELSRLREREKELVEALMGIKNELYNASGHSNTTIILRHLSNSRQLLESLLSKFEVPNV